MQAEKMEACRAEDAAQKESQPRAKLNDMNPQAYLRYVLERITHHPIKHIEELMPWNVASSLSPDLCMLLALSQFRLHTHSASP